MYTIIEFVHWNYEGVHLYIQHDVQHVINLGYGSKEPMSKVRTLTIHPPPLPSPQAYAFSEGEVDATSQDFESLLWWDFLESQYIGHTENKFTKMDSLSGINTSLLSAHLPGIPESGITPGDCSKVAGSKGIGSSDWSVSLLR